MIHQAKDAVQFFSTGFLRFQLRQGPVVDVRSLHVALTYDGWLEGLPRARFNDLHIADIPKRVKRLFPKVPIHICNVPRHCIAGRFATSVGGDRYEVKSPENQSAEFLPRLEVVAYCRAISDIPEPNTFTRLIIVWHQDEFEPLPVPRVRDEIEHLSWYQLAKVFEPL